MARIFISYKRVDKNKVFKIKDQIESTLSEKCWIDLDGIESDAQFINVIIKAIRDCEVFLFMYSKTHAQITDFEKDWTIRELNFASKKEKRIVFVNIDGSPLSDEFEFLYGTKQQVDGRSQESISRLLKDLAKWNENQESSCQDNSFQTNTTSNPSETPKRFGRKLSTFAKNVVKTVKDVDTTLITDGRTILSLQKGEKDATNIEGNEYPVILGNICFNMIRVEGGSLIVGATKEQLEEADNNEYPEHSITLPTYYIAQFPVTQNLWEAVMGYNKSKFRDKEVTKQINYSGAGTGAVVGSFFGPMGAAAGAFLGNKYLQSQSADIKGHYPAENLSHDEALEFVRRLSNMTNLHFSLPTEEEWEYAARGGQMSKCYKYAGGNDIDSVAWNKNNSDRHTHPVGEKQPNELGIYDMSGNVWEWTETPAHSYADNDDVHNGEIYIRRGGSWWHEPTNCRVSKRYASDKSKKTSGLGLRVVIRLK